MPDIKVNRDFDKFSYEEQIRILRYMYDFINCRYYNSQLPHDIDIRIHIMSENVVARYIRPDAYTPTVKMIQQYNSGTIESLPQQGIMFNELIICREPFSHRNVWLSFLEDTMAHEMVHEYDILHDIEDANWKMKNGKFTVLGYHNSFFKKTAIEHGQTCKKSNSRNGFNLTNLITHFPLESWMTK